MNVNKPTLIDFFATWGQCNELWTQQATIIKFIEVNMLANSASFTHQEGSEQYLFVCVHLTNVSTLNIPLCSPAGC